MTGEYAMLPRSTSQRTPRERSGAGGRTKEIQRLIGRSLRAAVDLDALGERTVIVDCDVLAADGARAPPPSPAVPGPVAGAGRPRGLGAVERKPLHSRVAAISVGIVAASRGWTWTTFAT